MKFIGYMLIAMASYVLSIHGFDFTTWQWWVITLGYIIGEFIVCESE